MATSSVDKKSQRGEWARSAFIYLGGAAVACGAFRFHAFLSDGIERIPPAFSTSSAAVTAPLVTKSLRAEKNRVAKRAQRLLPLLEHARAAAHAYQLEPELVMAVIAVESGGNLNARSNRGALGPMQLMPATARWLGVKNATHARDNIYGGAKYLRHLLDLFDGNLSAALAAYNAGPYHVKRHAGVSPYKETRLYVKKVMKAYQTLRTKRLEEGINSI